MGRSHFIERHVRRVQEFAHVVGVGLRREADKRHLAGGIAHHQRVVLYGGGEDRLFAVGLVAHHEEELFCRRAAPSKLSILMRLANGVSERKSFWDFNLGSKLKSLN